QQDALRAGVPAQCQRPGPEGLVEGLVERTRVARGVIRCLGRRLGHAAPIELGEELPEALRQDADLDLLQRDAHDAGPFPGLEEERAIARFADGPRDEAVGRIEDVATTRHAPTLYRNRPRPPSGGHARTRTAQPTSTLMVCQPRAPSGTGEVRCSVRVTP